jgi:hypothetical protein
MVGRRIVVMEVVVVVTSLIGSLARGGSGCDSGGLRGGGRLIQ